MTIKRKTYRWDRPDRLFGGSVVEVDLPVVRHVLLPRALGQELLGLGLESVRLLPRALPGGRVVEVGPAVRSLVLGPLLGALGTGFSHSNLLRSNIRSDTNLDLSF